MPFPGNKNSQRDESPALHGGSKRGFSILRLLGALSVVLILLATGAMILHRQLLQVYAPQILDSLAWQMEEFYDLEFTWSGASVTGLNDFTISGITLTDIPTDRKFLDCPAMRIRTSIFALSIRGRDPALAVTSVEFENPVITLGREDGKWNTGTLFEPTEGGAFEFPGQLGITLHNGKIRWQGGEVADGIPFPLSGIERFNATFRMDPGGAMGLKLDGMFVSEGFEQSPVNITADYDPEKLAIRIVSNVDSIDISLLEGWLGKYHLKNMSGPARVEMSMIFGQDAGPGGFSLIGKATLAGCVIGNDYNDLVAEDVNGDIHFSHQSLFASGLRGMIDDNPVEVRGRIGDFGNLSYDLAVDLASLSTGSIKSLLPMLAGIPVIGNLDARIDIDGPPGALEILVNSSGGDVAVTGIPLRINNISAWYSGGSYNLGTFDASTLGGQIQCAGSADISGETPAWDFRLGGGNMQIAKIMELFPLSVANDLIPSGDISFTLAGSGDDLSNPRLNGVLASGNLLFPRWESYGSATLSMPFSVDKSGMSIYGTSASNENLTLICNGNYIWSRGFNGDIAVTSKDPDFPGSLTGLDMSGRISLAGDFTYNLRGGSSFNGETIVTGGRFGTVDIGSLTARIRYEGDILEISNLEGLIGSGTLTGSMNIPLNGQSGMSNAGTFSITGMDLGAVLPEPYPQFIKTSLDMDGELTYTPEPGTRGALNLKLLIADSGAQLGANIINTGDEPLSVTLDIPLGSLKNSAVHILGEFSSGISRVPVYEGRVLSEYSSQVITKVTEWLTAGSQGPAANDGGNVPVIPTIEGDLNISAELYNVLELVSGQIEIASGRTKLSGFEISSGSIRLGSVDGLEWEIALNIQTIDEGSLNISGRVDRAENFADSTIALQAAITDSGINQAFQLIGQGGLGQFTGNLSGSGMIGGTLGAPVVDNFQLNMSESEVFGIALNEGGINFAYSPPNLTFQNLDISGHDGFHALGAGSVDLSAPSLSSASFVFRLDTFDLGLIGSATGQQLPVDGIVSAIIQLSQDASGAKVLYNVTIEDLKIPVGEDFLPLGNLSLVAVSRPGENKLNVTSMELKRNGESITGSGSLPFPSYRLLQEAINVAAKRQVDLSLDEYEEVQRLLLYDVYHFSIMSETGYTPEIPEGLLATGISWGGGLSTIDIQMGGKLLEPEFSGFFNLNINDILLGELRMADSLSGRFDASGLTFHAYPGNVSIRGNNFELGVEGHVNIVDLTTYFLGLKSQARIPVTLPDDAVQLALVFPENDPISMVGQGYSVTLKPSGTAQSPGLSVRNGKLFISGSIDVLQGNINIADLPKFPEPSDDVRETSAIDFGLTCKVPGSLSLRGGSLYMFQFEEGSIRFEGRDTNPSFSGTLSAPSGWIDILSNHFVLTNNLSMTFSSDYPIDPEHPFDPFVQAVAMVTIRDVRSPGFYGDELVVTARIDGRLTRMLDEMQLTSDPPLSQDDIMLALAYEDFFVRTAGDYLFGTGSSPTGFGDINIGNVFIPIASSYLTKYLRRQTGIADFELSLDEEQRVRIYIETEIMDNLVMYYRQTFGAVEDNYIWGSRYRFRPRSWVGFEVNSDEEITPQIEYIIPLD